MVNVKDPNFQPIFIVAWIPNIFLIAPIMAFRPRSRQLALFFYGAFPDLSAALCYIESNAGWNKVIHLDLNGEPTFRGFGFVFENTAATLRPLHDIWLLANLEQPFNINVSIPEGSCIYIYRIFTRGWPIRFSNRRKIAISMILGLVKCSTRFLPPMAFVFIQEFPRRPSLNFFDIWVPHSFQNENEIPKSEQLRVQLSKQEPISISQLP